jgi:DNA-binding NarL/FixJ family response regulator
MSVRVLVVDDNSLVLDGLRLMLTHAGMEVVEASTCYLARLAAEQPELDVALLDIKLPDGDGLELLAHLKSRRPELPILIHTYHDRQSYVAKSHALGASGYLVKGSDNQTLLDAIRAAVNGETVWQSCQLALLARA